MKRKQLTSAMLATLLMAVGVGCSDDLFNKEVYNNVVDYQFMVDNMDREHDWCLTKNDTITLITEPTTYSVQVLTANPYNQTNAMIAAEAVTYDNTATLAYTVPLTQHTMYAAALDATGHYQGVVAFSYGQKEIELSERTLLSGSILAAPTYQTFTYLYESTFPMPDDFDYNDMVLRISKSYPDLANSYVVDLSVKLEAAGASELYAAAIQLSDIRYDDISKIEIVEGEQMDKGYPLQRLFINQEQSLIRGRKGEAVINLFESAQWALNKKRDELGDIIIRNYNTAKGDQDENATVAPVSTTFRITFKTRETARMVTFDRIDPFILHQNSNGGIWEVHTYAHKFDATLKNVDASAYDNHISWALVIPEPNFRYAVEGMSLGTYNSELDAVFGPYTGFSEWMQNHETNLDWYQKANYPQYLY